MVESPGQQGPSALTSYEEDPLPSLPNLDDIFRSVGPRSTHGYSASSVFSSDDTDHNFRAGNSARVRRLSTATITSIGRPRYLTTRPKIKGRGSRDAVTFVRDVGTQELSSFLWTNNPSPHNWISAPEEKYTTEKRPWYRRRKTMASDKPVLQLPDCAVATKTPNGHWHIAIHIPASTDSEANNIQPQVEDFKDSDAMTIMSNRFSRRFSRPFSGATTINKTNHRQRSHSTNTVKTASDVMQAPKRLTKNPPQHSRIARQNSPTKVGGSTGNLAAAMLNPSIQGNDAATTTQVSTTVSVLDLPLSVSTRQSDLTFTSGPSIEHSERNNMHDQKPGISPQASGAFRKGLITNLIQQKCVAMAPSRSVEPPQSNQTDSGTQPFPDFLQSNNSQKIITRATSPPPTTSSTFNVTRSEIPSLVVSCQTNLFEEARAVALHTLAQAQREEKDAKAVVAKAEQDARESRPPLDAHHEKDQ